MERITDLSQSEEMGRESLTFTYDGPALRKGEFDLNLLGPSLVGLNELLTEVNTALNGSNYPLAVKVRTFRPGSFNIDMDVVLSWGQQAAVLLTGVTVTSTLNMLQIVGFAKDGSVSLLGLLRQLNGKAPSKVERHKNGTVTLHCQNNSVTVTHAVFNLYGNDLIAKSLAAIVKPLHSVGVEDLAIKSGDHLVQKITKEDVPIFSGDRLQVSEQRESSRRTTVTFRKLVLPFSEHRSRFKQGEHEFYAKISDETFLKSENRVAFKITDALDVDLVTRETMVGDVANQTFEILKVYRHIPGPEQTALRFE